MTGLYAIHRQNKAKTFVKSQAPFKRDPLYPRASSKIMRSSFYDPMNDQNLSGILDTLKAAVAPYLGKLSGKITEALDKQLGGQQIKLESKIGEFLQTGEFLTQIKGRAQGLENSPKPEVKSRAQAIGAKSNALLNQYSSLKSLALGLSQNIVSLKEQLVKDSALNFTSVSQMGSRALEIFNAYKSKVAKVVGDSAQTAVQIDSYLKQVKQVGDDITSLESYAQGKGWSATLSSVGSSYMNLTSSLAKIALIGAGIYFLAPTFISRMRRS